MENLRFIVGIGASAGGLKPICELIRNLPVDNNAAYVVVQHMSPDRKSMLTELISRETRLSVVQIGEDTEIAADTIYVCPPNRDVLVSDRRLKLVDPSPLARVPKPSVDRFLTSLASDMAERAVGVILSGTGSDGAYGVQAVHERGGIAIAQTAESAGFDGMPVAAIGSGCIDLVMEPGDIGTHLARIMATPGDLTQFKQQETDVDPLQDIFQIVIQRKRVDFRDYRRTTVNRRIERRMLALGITSAEDYTAYCRTHPAEVDALFRDLLISVTRFFRDNADFERLQITIGEMV
ncbi:MAG: chemotaxis protein CheB, partial [Pseudomonadota bacterium]